MTSSNSRIRDGLREFLVIVAGVLVALWIDAGWAWWMDRRDEAELLQDLASDYREALREIDQVYCARRFGAVYGYLALFEGHDQIPSDSIWQVANSFYALQSLNPPRGAVGGALASGRIDLIRSRELRNALAGWQRYYDEAEEEIDWVVAPWTDLWNEMHALDYQLGPLSAVSAAGDATWPDTSAAREFVDAVASSPTAQPLLLTKLRMHWGTVLQLPDLRDATIHILRLLGENPADESACDEQLDLIMQSP